MDDYYFAMEILSWYGGMGSLNDLVICPTNHHHIAVDEADRINEILSALKNDIAVEAQRLKRMAT